MRFALVKWKKLPASWTEDKTGKKTLLLVTKSRTMFMVLNKRKNYQIKR
jgi:hypothetical protein